MDSTSTELHSVVAEARRIFHQHASHISKARERFLRDARADIVWTTLIAILVPRFTVPKLGGLTTKAAARSVADCNMSLFRIDEIHGLVHG